MSFHFVPTSPDSTSMTDHEVAVLDYGSQYSQLIVRRVRELGFVSHLYPPAELANLKNPGAIKIGRASCRERV